MGSRIDEGGQWLGTSNSEYDGAAPHQISGQRTGSPPHHQRACDHAAAHMGARLSLDDDRAAPHAVAGTIAGVAIDEDDTAAHACHFSGERAAEAVSNRAGDLKLPTLHPGCGPGAGAAGNQQPAAGHQTPGLNADVAVDDDLAVAHLVTDHIETIAIALDANGIRLAHAQAKHVADADAAAGGVEREP